MTTVTSTGYRELDPDQYVGMQNSLLKVKGSATQREFLKALKDTEEFVALIEDKVQTNDGRILPIFDDALTESSFKEPTEDQEARMHALWREHAPANSLPSFFLGQRDARAHPRWKNPRSNVARC